MPHKHTDFYLGLSDSTAYALFNLHEHHLPNRGRLVCQFGLSVPYFPGLSVELEYCGHFALKLMGRSMIYLFSLEEKF